MKNIDSIEMFVCLVTVLVLFFCSAGYAENIDPNDDDSQYAYVENVGWFNAEPGGDGRDGVEVDDTELSDYIWAENIGWINLSPTYGGVTNDGDGNLGGYAWGENVGWVNFNPTNGGVTIDGNGNFDGWAWGENIGWIHFQNPSIPYKVQTAWAPTVSTTSTSGSSTTTTTPAGSTTTTGPNTTTTTESTTTSTGECTYGSCVTTAECTAAFGPGWGCQNGCCKEINGGVCPLSIALEDDESQLDTIRGFRDNVLSQSFTGRELIRLYYHWCPVIADVMEKDEKFKEEVKEMVEDVLELIGEVE